MPVTMFSLSVRSQAASVRVVPFECSSAGIWFAYVSLPAQWVGRPLESGSIAKVGFGRKPAAYPARAESRFCDMALKLSKMV